MTARNVYQVQLDGEVECYQAPTMAKACEAAWEYYWSQLEPDLEDANPEEEREHFDEEILQSCSLVGPLRN